MLPQGLDYEIAAMQNIATALGQLDPAPKHAIVRMRCIVEVRDGVV